MQGPSPDDPHPMNGFPQVGFLKPLVKNPSIIVGEYSYYDDPPKTPEPPTCQASQTSADQISSGHQ